MAPAYIIDESGTLLVLVTDERTKHGRRLASARPAISADEIASRSDQTGLKNLAVFRMPTRILPAAVTWLRGTSMVSS